MDKPADPTTPLREVYQSFFDDLMMHGTKATTIQRYRYNILRFESWLHRRLQHLVEGLPDAGRASTTYLGDQNILLTVVASTSNSMYYE